MLLSEMTILITGGASGIGFFTSLALAQQGCRLVLACRSPEKAREAAPAIAGRTGNPRIEAVELDLASLASVRASAAAVRARFARLDVLINNAGAFSMRRRETCDGFEQTMGVNYLAPFLFTSLLLPLLTATAGSRIINVCSNGYKQGRLDLKDFHLQKTYQPMRAYATSKLAQLLFTFELARRLKGAGVTVNALHPGHADTAIWPDDTWLEKLACMIVRRFMISAEEGARTSIYLASSAEVAGITGAYFAKCRPVEVPARFADPGLAAELFATSARLTGLT